MSYVKVWIHAVWSTKNRKGILEKPIRPLIFNHIMQNGIEKGLYMECVNGHEDHVHCLFRLRNDQTIMKSLQLLKGESSYWVNKQGLLKEKLVWQKEYYAVSVSESGVQNVKFYIGNQEEHHRKSTWAEEYDKLIRDYGFQVLKG